MGCPFCKSMLGSTPRQSHPRRHRHQRRSRTPPRRRPQSQRPHHPNHRHQTNPTSRNKTHPSTRSHHTPATSTDSRNHHPHNRSTNHHRANRNPNTRTQKMAAKTHHPCYRKNPRAIFIREHHSARSPEARRSPAAINRLRLLNAKSGNPKHHQRQHHPRQPSLKPSPHQRPPPNAKSGNPKNQTEVFRTTPALQTPKPQPSPLPPNCRHPERSELLPNSSRCGLAFMIELVE